MSTSRPRLSYGFVCHGDVFAMEALKVVTDGDGSQRSRESDWAFFNKFHGFCI